MNSLHDAILKLKREKNVTILAHLYEDGEIQDLADFVGDSFYLAQQGLQCDSPNLLLAGVVFMAESVKILAPHKTVLVPDRKAGCSLVDSSPAEKYAAWRRQHPDHLAVTYINSSAKVKAISDVIVTSSNAQKIIAAIPRERGILFGPDRHLGHYLSTKLNRPMKLWPGSCEVHVLFSARKIFELKEQYPEARVLAHPECVESVLVQADVVGSTSALLDEVRSSACKTFIVATEAGILHQMKRARPDAELIAAPSEGSCGCNECPYMKMNTLEKLHHALSTFAPQVEVDPTIASQARVSLDNMMNLAAGRAVHWPERFLQ